MPIIPRWEWRTFSDRTTAADAAFGALEPTGVQESDELYLLSGTDSNVKVRDDLMDIKLLRETDSDGLQRWEPVMKASFPMTNEQLHEVTRALAIDPPASSRDSWTLEQFISDVAQPAGVRAVPVHKRRVRYKVGGCTSEVTDLVVDGRPARTIAIELEDGATVVAAVRSVGLSGYLNVSYPQGLLEMINGAPVRYAVIDVGTNSVKFHVAEPAAGGWSTVADRAEVTRLGEGLAAAGDIAPAALERTAAAVAGMANEARSQGVAAIAIVGTAGLRMAGNSAAAVARISEAAGVDVQVISGEDESRLAYLAVVAALPMSSGSTVVFDTGGGSSQFTFGSGTNVDERFSVNVGAARITETFGLDRAVGSEAIDEAVAQIRRDLERLEGRTPPSALVGMGGAMTNLTAVSLEMASYDPNRVQGATLTRAEVSRQIEMYRAMSADERRSIVGLQPNRAEVILAGACIVRTVMDMLGCDSLTVSDRGLRHGVLAERFAMSK